MAEQTVTNRNFTSHGVNMRETGTFVLATAAPKTLSTSLSRIDWFRIMCTTTSTEQAATYYLNSNTTSDNASGYGGVVYLPFDNGDASYQDGQTYVYEAIGV